MSHIDGGQNKHESINVGTMEGNELTKGIKYDITKTTNLWKEAENSNSSIISM